MVIWEYLTQFTLQLFGKSNPNKTCIIMQIMLHIEEKNRKRQRKFGCAKTGFANFEIIRKIVYLP